MKNIKIIVGLMLIMIFSVHAKDDNFTTVELKYITADDALSVLKTLTEKPISASNNNLLIINGAPAKTKNIVKLIQKIDTLPSSLMLEFVSSKRKINFTELSNTYQSSRDITNTSQSMSIIERQWVKLNTGISIPINERRQNADGSETHSIRYKKIDKSYLFKVHEYDGKAIVQVGVNASQMSKKMAGAIQHNELETTIVGNTGEWLEISSSKTITENKKDIVLSTNRPDKNIIHLYIKITK